MVDPVKRFEVIAGLGELIVILRQVQVSRTPITDELWNNFIAPIVAEIEYQIPILSKTDSMDVINETMEALDVLVRSALTMAKARASRR